MPDISGDNIIIYAVIAGVAVVFISSAISTVFRVAAVAALALGGWMFYENPDKFTTDASTVVGEVETAVIGQLPEGAQENAQQILSGAVDTASGFVTEENVNSVFERLAGGLERLQEVVDGYESDKGVLPDSITPISER